MYYQFLLILFQDHKAEVKAGVKAKAEAIAKVKVKAEVEAELKIQVHKADQEVHKRERNEKEIAYTLNIKQ